ncbi:hypothetical protein N568_0103850, partial [Lactococcus garvieae TRF1]
GSYYYGIHVDSQLISPDNSEEFLPGGDSRLEAFLTGIKNNSMIDEGNARPDINLPPSSFDFNAMAPGRVFTMAGEHSTAQHSTAQHSTAQHSTAQHAVDNNRLFLLAPKRSGPLERFFRPLTLSAEGQVKRSKDKKRIIKKDKEREKVLL